ncbi:MAG TPA: hypothetical protein VK426_10895, partial [Methanobacterium sp.]|nr:hypothetical protein [Methanobacterium sp.]
FGDYSKLEAIEKIKSVITDNKTLIEVFDLNKSQMKYLTDLNKFFVMDSDSTIDEIMGELKETELEPKTEVKEVPSESEVKEPSIKTEVKDTENIDDNKSIESSIEPKKESETIIKDETENNGEEVRKKLKEISQGNPESSKDEDSSLDIKEPEVPEEPQGDSSQEIKAPVIENTTENKDSEPDVEESEENEFIEPGVEAETVDREDLMKKYGLKDVGEEEVDNIIESYKGGSLSDEDVEKIELTLMNKIKKSILGIPKIKGTEVMVFLDNTSELTGTINIITENEGKGLISRIMGDSKDLENLKKQIINITQMEVKKSFRGYPEIVDDFEINVEIS